MAFLQEYLQETWRRQNRENPIVTQSQEGWLWYLSELERRRKKTRIMFYTDTYSKFDFESFYVLRYIPDYPYLERFSRLGHRIYSRRSPEAIEAAKSRVASSVEKKELGGLSVWHDRAVPLEWYSARNAATAKAPELTYNDQGDVLNMYYLQKGFKLPANFSVQPAPAKI